jgi:hypothetical protein
MFILNSQDVKYCYVRYLEADGAGTFPGLSYRGHLFVQVMSYNSNQLEKAIQRCRQFLDLDEPVLSIVVKELNSISVWSENKNIELVEIQNSSSLTSKFERSKSLFAKLTPRSLK